MTEKVCICTALFPYISITLEIKSITIFTCRRSKLGTLYTNVSGVLPLVTWIFVKYVLILLGECGYYAKPRIWQNPFEVKLVCTRNPQTCLESQCKVQCQSPLLCLLNSFKYFKFTKFENIQVI